MMRAVKTPAEGVLLRRSAAIAAGALRRCMGATQPGITEYQLATIFGEQQCMGVLQLGITGYPGEQRCMGS